jgi:hypothetical protein
MTRLDIHRIATSQPRDHLHWNELSALRRDSPEADRLIAWLTGCVESGRAEPFKQEP